MRTRLALIASAQGFCVQRGDVTIQCDSADAARDALLAAFAEQLADDGIPRGARFRATFLEGEPTVDGRVVAEQATTFNRPPPLPWMLATHNSETGMPHGGAELCGVIDTVTREGALVILEGFYDSGSEAGQEGERIVHDGILTTWSPDFSPDASVEIDITITDEGEDVMMTLTSGDILGGTQVPFPALTSARIELIEATVDEPVTPEEPAADETEPVAASVYRLVLVAASAPVKPSASWFQDPELHEPTPLAITEEGRVFGHAAQWNVCHSGIPDRCVVAPHSPTDYAYFLTGSLLTEEDELVRVGQLTMGCGHADLSLPWRAAVAHYDGGPGATQWADVTCGEDEHGIWVAGALRPELTDEQVRQARALGLSGDWRRLGGSLDLIAALSVPAPGYPVSTALAASAVTRLRVEGPDCVALVAAGVVFAKPDPLRERVERLERIARRDDLLRRVSV